MLGLWGQWKGSESTVHRGVMREGWFCLAGGAGWKWQEMEVGGVGTGLPVPERRCWSGQLCWTSES